MFVCAKCGKEFTGRKRKYCSKECCRLAHGRNQTYTQKKNCLCCGAEFIPSGRIASRKKYCSINCQAKQAKQRNKASINKYEKRISAELTDRIVKRNIYIGSKGRITYDQMTPEMIADKRNQILQWRNRDKTPKIKEARNCKCIICGKDFIGKQINSNKCSYECAYKEQLNNMRQKYADEHGLNEIFKCKECGKEINRREVLNLKVFCSIRCSRKHERRICGNSHKHRARHFGCKYESVNPIKVFERDKWHCQLCGKKLNRQDRGTIQDNAPELDHIIPLSKGGEHSYRNTQCACRKCNIDKGNNIVGQTRLFG